MQPLASPSIEEIIEWDILNWSRALACWRTPLARYKPGETRVLCVGERHGGLSLWFASQGYRVVCSDFGGPSERARALHAKHGVGALVDYMDLDIFDTKLPDESFDVIAFKSVIGGLRKDPRDRSSRTVENQKLAVNEIRRLLRPGGTVLAAENMRGTWVHDRMRRLAKGVRIGWRHLSVEELEWLFSDFPSVRFQYFGLLGTLHKWAPMNRLFHSMDVVLSAIFPNRWLYISFICANK